MNFPAYVPAAVRAHITTLCGPAGVQEVITRAEIDLAKIKSAIETKIQQGEFDCLADLQYKSEVAAHFLDDLQCIRRLTNDTRMSDVYAMLTREFIDDQQWIDFVISAWLAWQDYNIDRDRLKRTMDLKDEIVKASEKLESLLAMSLTTFPHEFSSFHSLLGRVANAARSFKPSESGYRGAAIKSRQRNMKMEYLRAWQYMMADGTKITLTAPIMQAMATTANVVINLPDVDLSYDDVRKAFAKQGGQQMENSDEK